MHATNGAQEAAGITNEYSYKVFNYAEDIDGKVYPSDDEVSESGGPLPGGPLLVGSQVFEGDKASEATVGFCSFPATTQTMQSHYWVLAYEEEEGYALIAKGQPFVPTIDGLCTYGNTFARLWIFSRSPVRNEFMIEKYRATAIDNGIDPVTFGTRVLATKRRSLESESSFPLAASVSVRRETSSRNFASGVISSI